MSEQTEYEVSEEIKDLFLDARVAQECRDSCLNLFFKTKRAIYYGREAVRAREKAWRMVYELYPELRGKGLTYRLEEENVVVNK